MFEQLTSERLVTRHVKGHARLEWVKSVGRRNEALDCAVYALSGAVWVGIDRWKEGDWKRWADRVEAVPVEAPEKQQETLGRSSAEALKPAMPRRGRFNVKAW